MLRIFSRSDKILQDLLVAGVMRAQQFDHGSNRFAIDAIERPPGVGDCTVVWRPSRALPKKEPQRIERFPEARRRNDAVPIRVRCFPDRLSSNRSCADTSSRTVEPPSGLSLTSAPRLTRYATVSGVVMSDAAAAISSRRSSVAGSGFSRFRIFGFLAPDKQSEAPTADTRDRPAHPDCRDPPSSAPLPADWPRAT